MHSSTYHQIYKISYIFGGFNVWFNTYRHITRKTIFKKKVIRHLLAVGSGVQHEFSFQLVRHPWCLVGPAPDIASADLQQMSWGHWLWAWPVHSARQTEREIKISKVRKFRRVFTVPPSKVFEFLDDLYGWEVSPTPVIHLEYMYTKRAMKRGQDICKDLDHPLNHGNEILPLRKRTQISHAVFMLFNHKCSNNALINTQTYVHTCFLITFACWTRKNHLHLCLAWDK